MEHHASLPAPPRRARRAVLAVLAVIGLASVLFVIRRPLLMSAPMCTSGRWGGCFGTFNGVVLITVTALPVAALVVCVLARWRTAIGAAFPWRMSLAEVAMVYGTLPCVWLTLLPGPGAGVVPGKVSLVPLRDLSTMPTLQIIGNLLLFAALGFFAPVRFGALRSVPRVLALGAACSVLIETSQYVFWLDRVSSVDDVLVNTVGAGLAGLLSRRWWRGRTTNVARSRG